MCKCGKNTFDLKWIEQMFEEMVHFMTENCKNSRSGQFLIVQDKSVLRGEGSAIIKK